MARLPNYDVSDNPFHLAGPPDYWLRALWNFDNSLLVMPSKQGFYYRVCQRRPPTFSLKVVHDIMKEDADARMMAAKGVVPVTTLLATTNWANYPIHMEELRKRAPWRLGGAEKVIQDVEQGEWLAEQERKRQFDENVLTPLSKDAWGLYNKKLGLRSHMYSPTVKGSATEAPKKGIGSAPKTDGIKVGSIFIS